MSVDYAAVIAEAVQDTPDGALAGVVAALEAGLLTARSRVRLQGGDPKLEELVAEAKSWLHGEVETATLRALLAAVELHKGKTSFDEGNSNMRRNVTAADFDIAFSVGEDEGMLCGSAADGEGEVTGQVESTFLYMEDGDLATEKYDWAADGEPLKASAEAWRANAGLDQERISWQDTARAVAAALAVLVPQSGYNDDDWVWEFLVGLLKRNLALLPGQPAKKRQRED
jgi:hypothetical protein